MRLNFKLVIDIFRYAAEVIRRETLCASGHHLLEERAVEVLALGEKVICPVCIVYGCGYKDLSKVRIEKPYQGDGKLFAMHHTTGELKDLGGAYLSEFQKQKLKTMENK